MLRKAALLMTLAILLTAFAPAANILVLNLDRNQENTGPDPNSSTNEIRPLLTSSGYPHDYLEVALNDHTTLATMNFNSYDLLIICAGTTCLFQRSHQFTSAEGQHLVDYLNAGGYIYMEGNDVWYHDPRVAPPDGPYFDFSSAFQVNPSSDGGNADMWRVRGITGSPVASRIIYYDLTGDNCYNDIIDKIAGVGTKWFENEKNNPPNYTRQSMWISYSSGTYKTIASSFEFGDLIDGTGNDTKAYVWGKVMDFFDIPQGSTSGDVDGDGGVDADDLALLADYLAGNVGTLPSPADADTNSSGAVNAADLTVLQNYLVGHIASLPYTG